MKLNLKRVSKVKQDLIREVVDGWLAHLRSDNKDAFVLEMGRLGWSGANLHGFGSFKRFIWKDNIIAKFANTDNQVCSAEIDREWEQFNTAPTAIKKYLPNAYILKNGLLVQDRVVLKCNQVSKCNVDAIANELKLNDYGHNHAHNFVGTVKFFDWVWRRHDPWTSDFNKPLKDEF